MARKRIQLPTTYEKIINNLCLLHNCTSKDATKIYRRKVELKLLPE